jgi:hypothetical protein
MTLLMSVLMAVAEEEPGVWVFFSPDSPEAAGIFRQLQGRPVRAVLLVERYFGDREPSEAFVATLQAAGEVRAFDEEGLAMAKRLGIRRLPAVAVVRSDHAHIASGSRVDVKGLLQCSR